MQFKKFKSTKDDIRVASLSGHVAIITKELVDVPDILWGQAYAAGAISEDMQVDSMAEYISEKKKEQEEVFLKEREEIKEVLKGIYANPQGFVDKDNRPIIRKVIGLIQKPVKKDVVDSIWDEVIKEGE